MLVKEFLNIIDTINKYLAVVNNSVLNIQIDDNIYEDYYINNNLLDTISSFKIQKFACERVSSDYYSEYKSLMKREIFLNFKDTLFSIKKMSYAININNRYILLIIEL